MLDFKSVKHKGTNRIGRVVKIDSKARSATFVPKKMTNIVETFRREGSSGVMKKNLTIGREGMKGK